MINLVVLIVTALLGAAEAYAAPQQNGAAPQRKRVVVERATSEMSIDGFLREADWSRAEPLGDILQREPREGMPATERTDVRMLHDSENLYIGIYCYDSAPGGIIGTQMSRDADLSVDDRVELLLDTFRDSRNAFYFATNPLGAIVDGLVIESANVSREWDAIWNVRTARATDGWTAEFAIPFKSLGFNKGQVVWGFNFARWIKRKSEEDRWASPQLDVRFYQVSEAGEIEGLADVEQGVGLDIRPYVAGKMIDAASPGNTHTKGDAGLDAFYNITPSLKLTTTFNTDFAETEVDNRQINLTRFSIQFPEKRSFFLENAGVFTFAGSAGTPGIGGGGGAGGADVIPFFSRRIGLVSGREVPIAGGLKLTGKAGPYDVGILDVRTRDSGAIDAGNFFVGRIKRNIWQQSYIGAIFTDGDPSSSARSQTYGADVRLGTSRFLGSRRNFNMQAYFVDTRRAGAGPQDAMYGAGVSYPNDLWSIEAGWTKVPSNFNPSLGFVPRTNFSKMNFSVNFAPRPRNFMGIRRMNHQFRFTQFSRLDDGAVESWRLFTAPVNYTFNSEDRFEFNYAPQFERLFRPFQIARGVTLPVGDYRFDRWRLEFVTSSRRRLKVDTTWWFGTYWSGRANELFGSIQYKVAPHFQAQLGYNQTFATLPEGNFVARIFTLRADYSVSPLLTFSNLIQYDNDSKNLGWQTRARWIIRPGREIFIVFNQGWIKEDGIERGFRAADRTVSVKAQHTFRF